MTPFLLYQEKNNTSTARSVVSNHTSVQIDWETAQNTCDLKMFLSEVFQDEENQLLNPEILDVIEGAKTI